VVGKLVNVADVLSVGDFGAVRQHQFVDLTVFGRQHGAVRGGRIEKAAFSRQVLSLQVAALEPRYGRGVIAFGDGDVFDRVDTGVVGRVDRNLGTVGKLEGGGRVLEVGSAAVVSLDVGVAPYLEALSGAIIGDGEGAGVVGARFDRVAAGIDGVVAAIDGQLPAAAILSVAAAEPIITVAVRPTRELRAALHYQRAEAVLLASNRINPASRAAIAAAIVIMMVVMMMMMAQGNHEIGWLPAGKAKLAHRTHLEIDLKVYRGRNRHR